MGVFLIVLIIANYVCCFLTAKYNEGDNKNKNLGNIFFVVSIIIAIIAAVLLIKVIDSNNNGGAVGNYSYYINGKKVSSATYASTQNFGIGFMFFILLFGSGMAISANIVGKKNKPKTNSENKKPNVVALIFSIIGIVFGSTLMITSICVFTNVIKGNSTTSPIIAIILGIVLIVLGVKGILVFKDRKAMLNN